MDTNRLAKELRDIAADTKSGVTVTVLGDNLAHMQGTLQGASHRTTHTQNDSRAKQIAPTARPQLAMLLFRISPQNDVVLAPSRDAKDRRFVTRLTAFANPRPE